MAAIVGRQALPRAMHSRHGMPAAGCMLPAAACDLSPLPAPLNPPQVCHLPRGICCHLGRGPVVVLGHQNHLANALMDSPLGLLIQNRQGTLRWPVASAACLAVPSGPACNACTCGLQDTLRAPLWTRCGQLPAATSSRPLTCSVHRPSCCSVKWASQLIYGEHAWNANPLPLWHALLTRAWGLPQ